MYDTNCPATQTQVSTFTFTCSQQVTDYLETTTEPICSTDFNGVCDIITGCCCKCLVTKTYHRNDTYNYTINGSGDIECNQCLQTLRQAALNPGGNPLQLPPPNPPINTPTGSINGVLFL
jgi:hypothetical protein